MNLKEAYIVQDYHLSVTVKQPTHNLEFATGEYKIFEITRCFNKICKQYYYTATLSEDRRSLFTANISCLIPVAGYEGFIAEKVREREKQKFENALFQLYENLGTKKKVNAYISEIINTAKERKYYE